MFIATCGLEKIAEGKDLVKVSMAGEAYSRTHGCDIVIWQDADGIWLVAAEIMANEEFTMYR
jgi:hypothetical protein